MKLSQRRMNGPSLGGILATRQGSLALALLCALIAACVLVFALGRYKTSVTQPVPQATVLVATSEIAKGTTGAQIAAEKLYRVEPVTASQVAAGAIANAADFAGQTVSAAILPGQQLTSSDFASLAGVGLALAKGQRAIEISVTGANAASDITQAGSRIDIYADPEAGSSGSSSSGSSSSSSSSSTGSTLTASSTLPSGGVRLLLSNIDVLKPATATAVPVGNQSVGGSTLVLAVQASQVPTLIDHASSLYVVLRPGDAGATPATPTTSTTATAGGS